jgi:putrescine aminotransferase
MNFINLQSIENLNKRQIDKIYKRNYNEALYKLFKYSGIDLDFVKASGMFVYDSNGNEYIDYLAGFGALCLGHNDKRILEAVQKFNYRPNMLQIAKNKFPAVLANNISYLTDDELSYCYFTNSGSEAVEEAIKLVLLYKNGGNIIYFSNAYHGKTLGALSALGNKSKKSYKPLMSNFIEIPFGDIDAVEDVIKKEKVSAVLVEPIQGAGGINEAPKGFFKQLRKICDKKDVIFIMDEVKTGLGRCGTMFCYKQFGVVPDVMCLAKALSGGIMSIGAIVVEQSLWEDTYGRLKNATLLSSTFSGNTLACAAAIKTLEINIKRGKFPRKSSKTR